MRGPLDGLADTSIINMPRSSLRSFQDHVVRLFTARHLAAVKEWRSLLGEQGTYAPRVDVAVGPFAYGDLQLSADFDKLSRLHWPLLRSLIDRHRDTLAQYAPGSDGASIEEITGANPNARCFVAIEIENAVSRKHLMGGAVNAAALGRIGIVVGGTAEKVRALVRTRAYLKYLARVGKPSLRTDNLLIMTRENLEDCLR